MIEGEQSESHAGSPAVPFASADSPYPRDRPTGSQCPICSAVARTRILRTYPDNKVARAAVTTLNGVLMLGVILGFHLFAQGLLPWVILFLSFLASLVISKAVPHDYAYRCKQCKLTWKADSGPSTEIQMQSFRLFRK